MRIAFLGTPQFAVPSLEALIATGAELCVFTQPDKPVGRKQVLTPSPVKVCALEHGIEVKQFDKIKSSEGVQAMRDFAPDLCVTAAFGQFLSQKNLDIPRLGTINVHASLLPKYRGASPIQSAIINGDEISGVTIMLTELAMDAGDILASIETPIDPNESCEQLSTRLSIIGAELLIRVVKSIENGTASRTPQDESLATKCFILTRQSGKLDFSRTCRAVHDLVRGTNPWPGAYASLGDSTIKLWQTSLCNRDFGDTEVGTLAGGKKEGLFVRCSDGWLSIESLQLAGAKRLDGRVFLVGNNIIGKKLS